MLQVSTPIGKSVSIVTMGCAKNEVDSAHMAARLSDAGYALEPDPEQADAVIVNTCAFIQAATEESIDAILEAAGSPNVASGRAKLVVTGCMPSRYGDELSRELPEVSAFLSCADESEVVEALDHLLSIERTTSGCATAVAANQVQGSVSAYVKISEGCDRFCSYCAIPFIRGRYHSFPLADIEREVSAHIRAGAREIVLIAQDTGRWGADFDEPSSLAALMGHLAERHRETWFRVMYVQPEGVTDELIEAVATHENLCSYFDIPFQHCNPHILKAMNRSGSGDAYLDLVERIRRRIPGAALRTTLIAGFPGEDDSRFDELCDFVEEACFDYVGVFAYSSEEGTRAAELPDQVDEEEKLSRAQRLRDLSDSVSGSVVGARVGRSADVLVCGTEEDGQLFGRTMGQAPEVDGVTYLDRGEVGRIVRVRIDGTLLYEMEGTVLS